jgi:hypothetical protein
MLTNLGDRPCAIFATPFGKAGQKQGARLWCTKVPHSLRIVEAMVGPSRRLSAQADFRNLLVPQTRAQGLYRE